MIHILEVN